VIYYKEICAVAYLKRDVINIACAAKYIIIAKINIIYKGVIAMLNAGIAQNLNYLSPWSTEFSCNRAVIVIIL